MTDRDKQDKDKVVPTGAGNAETVASPAGNIVHGRLPGKNKILSNANAGLKSDSSTSKKQKKLVGNDGAG